MKSPDRLSQVKRRLALSRPVSFTYDHTTRSFNFGNKSIAPQDILEFGAPYSIAEDELSDDSVTEMLETVPMVYTYRAPISLPVFQKFIYSGWTKELTHETIQVMADLMPEIASMREGLSLEQLGFRAMCIRENANSRCGRIDLGVPGSCACLGPDATTPGWGSQYWSEGIMNYSYHNINIPTQRIALMGGLGHLAFRAKQTLEDN